MAYKVQNKQLREAPCIIRAELGALCCVDTEELCFLQSFCRFSQRQLSAQHIHAISQLPVGTGS